MIQPLRIFRTRLDRLQPGPRLRNGPYASKASAGPFSAGASKPRLLVVDDTIPLTALGSGYSRMAHILHSMSSLGWDVVLFPIKLPNQDWSTIRQDVSDAVEFAVEGTAMGLHRYLLKYGNTFDVVLISRPHNMRLFRDIKRKLPVAALQASLFYDAEGLFAARDILEARYNGRPMSRTEIEAAIRSEIALADGTNAVICVSEHEAESFRRLLSIPVYVVSQSTQVAANPPGFADRQGFLFVGRLLERRSPNWLGLAWFIRECWPHIRTHLPDATLRIAGHTHSGNSALRGPGITLLGPVDDLTPLYDSARVFIAPILFESGIPLKVMNASAAGLPVCGTHLMAELMDWTHAVEISTADTPRELAAKAVSLHSDPVLWAKIQSAARDRLRADHGADKFEATLKRLFRIRES